MVLRTRKAEPAPFLVTSRGEAPSSRARISTTRGMSKPPRQRPVPSQVRRLMRVIGAGRDGGVDLGDDLALGDHLAAADDPPVARVFGDQPGLFLAAEVAEARARRADGVPVGLFAQHLAGVFEQLDHALGDGGRGGQAGRFDAAQVDQSLRVRREFR